ncbi:hypothetical protein CRG98_008108 [Punica granatum]|uniref:Uncharacterized protein n=1 Tax=Punica granatum TaxID=22663 RepID=A0A2I0KSY9_PUNGR|nr:hypothetical protein CRG98_008108 [Punica granatum]
MKKAFHNGPQLALPLQETLDLVLALAVNDLLPRAPESLAVIRHTVKMWQLSLQQQQPARVARRLPTHNSDERISLSSSLVTVPFSSAAASVAFAQTTMFASFPFFQNLRRCPSYANPLSKIETHEVFPMVNHHDSAPLHVPFFAQFQLEPSPN